MIQSNRQVKVSLHTTPDVADALEKEAARSKRSKSKLVHDLLVESLRARGHEVTGYEYRMEER